MLCIDLLITVIIFYNGMVLILWCKLAHLYNILFKPRIFRLNRFFLLVLFVWHVHTCCMISVISCGQKSNIERAFWACKMHKTMEIKSTAKSNLNPNTLHSFKEKILQKWYFKIETKSTCISQFKCLSWDNTNTLYNLISCLQVILNWRLEHLCNLYCFC